LFRCTSSSFRSLIPDRSSTYFSQTRKRILPCHPWKNYSVDDDAKHRCLAFIHILPGIKLDYLKEESIMRKMKFGILLVFAVLALVGTVSAGVPLTTLGGPITFASDGSLVVTYINSEAGYNNEFGIYTGEPPVYSMMGFIHSPEAPIGLTYNGRCSAGVPVVLYIKSPSPYNHVFRSDVVGGDEKVHANVTGTGPYTVAFEDEYWPTENPDWDYNDVVLTVACTPDTIPTPEFPTLALPAGLIIGMLGVALFIQKTKEV
jgi:hypothetical protein